MPFPEPTIVDQRLAANAFAPMQCLFQRIEHEELIFLYLDLDTISGPAP